MFPQITRPADRSSRPLTWHGCYRSVFSGTLHLINVLFCLFLWYFIRTGSSSCDLCLWGRRVAEKTPSFRVINHLMFRRLLSLEVCFLLFAAEFVAFDIQQQTWWNNQANKFQQATDILVFFCFFFVCFLLLLNNETKRHRNSTLWKLDLLV